jgi:hypothetical protein
VVLIAVKIFGSYCIGARANPADLVSKPWGHQQVWYYSSLVTQKLFLRMGRMILKKQTIMIRILMVQYNIIMVILTSYYHGFVIYLTMYKNSNFWSIKLFER